MRTVSLRWKLLIGSICLVLIPLTGVACFSLIQSSKALEEASSEKVLRIAENLASDVEQNLGSELRIIKTLTVRDSIVKLGMDLAKNGENDPTVEAERAQVSKELTAAMKEMGSEGYEGVIFLNTEGVLFADARGVESKGLALGDRDYFKGAKSGKITIGKIAQSKATGKGIVPIGAPVLSPTGEFLGAIGIIMKLDHFAEKVANTKVGSTGYVLAVNEDGLIIAHRDKDVVFKKNIKEIQGAENVAQKMLSKQTGVGTYSTLGIERIAGYAPIGLTGWSIAASLTRDEFLAPVYGFRKGIIIAGAIFLMLSIVTTIVFARKISRPIAKVVEGMTEAAEQVSSGAGQVSSAAQQLAEGTSEQAASIEETSSSLEELASMTKQNADHSKQANQLMSGTMEVASRAGGSMAKLAASMVEISRASEETSKIIKTIDEIAFQTNLLALNAAVEAARAGEAGAGFAVVADEVRNLAMRAADAAKNTATLIEGTVKKVKEGSDLVGITEKEFHDLAASVEKSAGLVGEISAASTEQAQGIEQINKAVNEMDKVVQQNAANAEESASASEEMNAQAYQIKDFVGELKTMVDGSKGRRSANKEKSVKNRMEMAAVSGKKSGSHAHNIAQKALPPSKVKKSQAEKLIPLEETEITDF